MTRAFGRSVRRKEDARLLTGRGKYAADFRLPGMLHAAVLRSPHAHARLGAIRAKAALALPGVVAVVTAEDLGDIGRIPVRLGPRPSVVACLQPPLAREKVRYVGEPVAVVMAESRYLAEDALDLIEVDYDPLPTVADAARALEAGSPVLHEAIAGNLVDTIETHKGDAAGALAAAPYRVRERFPSSVTPGCRWRRAASPPPTSRAPASCACGGWPRCRISTAACWPTCSAIPST